MNPRNLHTRPQFFALLASLVLAFVLAPTPAFAGALGDARDAGKVGEKPDGYVGIVIANPDSSVRALVNDINQKRRESYAKIARRNGTGVEQVAALAGIKLIRKAKSGHYVQNEKGDWVRKP